MRFVLATELHEFARQTRAFLAQRIERNVHATVLENLVAGRFAGVRFTLAYGLGDDGAVGFAALRTPPSSLLATELEPGDAGAFTELWLTADPDVPGVGAVPETGRAIAAAWSELTGRVSRCSMREAIHVLDRVIDPPRPAPGELRPADREEHGLLVDWMHAFSRESGVIGGDQVSEIVKAQIAAGRMLVWDDGGPVSMLGVSPAVSRVVRIGPVYTPPERRRRGYATTMVAAASRRALADGADRCMLFTDLANPTSNKIYAEVGYRRVGDWEEHAFERP